MSLSLTGAFVSLAGSLFLFLGALGLVRMPDVYNRMQAGTKTTTLGSMLFLAGIAIAQPTWASRIVLLVLFLLFTNPLSSHALARAAHHSGIRLSRRSVRDDLLERDEQGGTP